MSGAEFRGSWRCALRIARRAAWRHRARNALALALLTVPVFGATLLVMAWENVGGATERQADYQLGRADVALGGDAMDHALSRLPAGSRTLPYRIGRTVVDGPGGWQVAEYEAAHAGDPLTFGRYVPVSGRAPHGPAEVAVTGSAARHLRVGPGDQLTAGLPPRQLTVVGIINRGRSLREPALFVAPDAPLSSGGERYTLVGLPAGVGWEPPSDSGRHGDFSYTMRSAMGLSGVDLALQTAAVALVGGFAGAQVVLLVGATFAIGAQRQRRELAIVAAAGATARQVGRVVLAGGLLLGVLAATVGSTLALLTFRLAEGPIERLTDHPLLTVSVPTRQLVAIAVVAVVAGLLAALLPARAAGRRPTRAQLSTVVGRSRQDLLWLLGGSAVAIVGVVAVSTSAHPDGSIELLAGGAVAGLLGALACAPALVRLAARAGGRLPLSGRLALRQAGRHRLRTGAAVAAVAAAVAGSVAVILVAGARDPRVTGPSAQAPVSAQVQVMVPQSAVAVLGPDGLRRVTAALSATAAVPLSWVSDGTGPVRRLPAVSDGTAPAPLLLSGAPETLAVGDPTALAVILGRPATAAESQALRDGGAVVFDPALAVGDRTQLFRPGPGPRFTLGAVVAVPGPGRAGLAAALVTPETARRLALPATPAGVVLDPGRRPTDTQLAAANAVLLAAQATTTAPPADPVVLELAPLPADGSPHGPMFLLLAAISGLVTVAASAVAVGLSGSETRGDLTTMVAAGATPRVRRAIAAVQAGVIVGLGTLLGTAAGVLPAAGYIAHDVGIDWHPPWLPLLLTVAVAPALATALAGALSRAPANLTQRAN
ncbi:MAG TPA: FtsX-like permease family protein [Catenuloplanes sp.]|jgi:putative ABC transport system permease protein